MQSVCRIGPRHSDASKGPYTVQLLLVHGVVLDRAIYTSGYLIESGHFACSGARTKRNVENGRPW